MSHAQPITPYDRLLKTVAAVAILVWAAYVPLLILVLTGRLAPVVAVSDLTVAVGLTVLAGLVWLGSRVTSPNTIELVQSGQFQSVSRSALAGAMRGRPGGVTYDAGLSMEAVEEMLHAERRDSRRAARNAYWSGKADLYRTLLEPRTDDPQ